MGLSALLLKSLKHKAARKVASVVVDKAIDHGKNYMANKQKSQSEPSNFAAEHFVSSNDEAGAVVALQSLLSSQPSDGLHTLESEGMVLRVTVKSGGITHIEHFQK